MRITTEVKPFVRQGEGGTGGRVVTSERDMGASRGCADHRRRWTCSCAVEKELGVKTASWARRPAVLIALERDVGTSWGVWSAATIAEEEDDGCVKHLGGRRSGHGADVDVEPDLCKVMA